MLRALGTFHSLSASSSSTTNRTKKAPDDPKRFSLSSSSLSPRDDILPTYDASILTRPHHLILPLGDQEILRVEDGVGNPRRQIVGPGAWYGKPLGHHYPHLHIATDEMGFMLQAQQDTLTTQTDPNMPEMELRL